MGFTFNGTHSDDMHVVVNKAKRPLAMPITPIVEDVPGRAGAYYFGSTKGVRKIDVECYLIGTSLESAATRVHALAAWLITPYPAPLIFDDDPLIQYYAILSGDIDLDEMSSFRKFTLVFDVPDPYSYSVNEDATDLAAGSNTITNNGGVEAYPRFQFTLPADAHFVQLEKASTGEVILVGTPREIEKPPVAANTVVLVDGCDTTTGWSTGTNSDGGIVAGTIASDGAAFHPTSYGSGTAWHGPTLRKALTSPATDFTVRLRFRFDTANKSIGRCECYLLDTNGSCFGKVAMKDSRKDIGFATAEARIGPNNSPTWILSDYRPSSWWGRWDGVMEISRGKGTFWKAYFAETDSKGREVNTKTAYKTNTTYKTTQLGMIEVHFGAYATNLTPKIPEKSVAILHISVVRHNDVSSTDSPLYIPSGTLLEIDCDTQSVRFDGQSKPKYLSPDSKMFALDPGTNTISVSTDATLSPGAARAFVRPRWL